MNPDEIARDMLTVGSSVKISTRSRKDSRVLEGVISEILTSADTHPHGILVRLESGDEGRVQEILHAEAPHSETVNQKYVDRRDPLDINQLVTKGESHYLEYKESLLWSQDLSSKELGSASNETKRYGRDASKIIVGKVIASFLNSDGGSLVIGVREADKSSENIVTGIESEYSKLKDKSEDGYRRLILDGIISSYFTEFVFTRFADYLRIDFAEIDGRTICIMRANQSDKPVFMRTGKENNFFVRVDASIRQLHDESILEYCRTRFPA